MKFPRHTQDAIRPARIHEWAHNHIQISKKPHMPGPLRRHPINLHGNQPEQNGKCRGQRIQPNAEMDYFT